MKKILLIDDLALKGWKSIIEKAIVRGSGDLVCATSLDQALNILRNEEIDLIFLDVRLTEDDHKIEKVSEMSGYKIINEIKKSFTNQNFYTPIILITATNKIWNIEAFQHAGIDAHYIKEHPDYGFSAESSKANLEQLQRSFLKLITVSEKRKSIWHRSFKILSLLDKHKYFTDHTGNRNIRSRIGDKVRLGYGYLFRKHTEVEENIFNNDNYSLSFIIYWSILEELVKAYSYNNTWDKNNNYVFSGDWKFRNEEYFIRTEDNFIIVNPFWENGRKVQKEIDPSDHKHFEKYSKGKLNLSDQIFALLCLFNAKDKLESEFKLLNKYRNRIDYIHSSVGSIYDRDLIDNKKSLENIYKVLDFIIGVLALPED